MEKMRIAIAKKAATQYVGHLDFGRALERALRRAKLPVAFSEGFNPHMKISFGPALSVGVASYAEYVDVELQEHVDAADFGERLAQQLGRRHAPLGQGIGSELTGIGIGQAIEHGGGVQGRG